MRKITFLLALISLATLVASASNRAINSNAKSSKQFELALSDNEYLKNTVIVKLKPEFRNVASTTSIQQPALIAYLNSIGITNIKKIFPLKNPPLQSKNERGETLVDLSLIYELNYSASLPLEKVIHGLLGLSLFEYAEPHYVPKTLYLPNDPQADSVSGAQYHLKNIHAYEGWDIDKGDTNVVIGITDTGFDFTHEDLVGNVKLNYQDPLDNVDNDNDGYVDNYKGWDVGMMDNNPQFSNASPHGVFVSGCAGATTDNDTGIAGSGFKCKLLPIKISDDAGNLTMAYEGIVYAADHGCQIINCSWGGTGGTQYGQNIVDYATFNMNALVIAAAGNNDLELVFYPASYNNVINVGGSDSTDKKWDDPFNANHGSNYGIYLDVFAPGDELYSTWKNNTYTQGGTSGTSFACPIAAGIAGIIKSHFPAYSAKQVGEKLKVTCDNMDVLPQNAPYIGKLGHGRINLFKALTDTSSSSVEMSSYAITDYNDDALVIGDTARMTGVFTNYLALANNVTASISSTSPYITILSNTALLGSINTMGTANNNANPFIFKILPNTPLNYKVILKVTINNGVTNTFQYLEVIVNVDYINIDINDVATSVTSTGRIGYSLPNQDQGLGFTYLLSSSQLYESSLMIGNSASQVSDMARSTANSFDNDLGAAQLVQRILPAVTSDMDLQGFFNDDNAGASKLRVFVRHDSYAWTAAAHRKYIVRKFTIYNNNVIPLNTLYAGIFADWDVQNASFNKADFDSVNRMGYVYSTQASPIYCGIKLLSTSGIVVNSMDNVGGGAGGIDLTDGYSTAEKFQSLSVNRKQAGNTVTAGNDVVQVISAGPFTMAPDDSVVVEFAMIAGNSLQDLQISALNAQQKYDSAHAVGITQLNKEKFALQIFPNPTKGNLNLQWNSLLNENCTISLFNADGLMVKKITSAEAKRQVKSEVSVNLEGLAKGIYFIRFQSQFRSEMQKLVLVE
ncbi:MAG: S8 family serine peptidase [Bacteroidetes bacterium]|nr:S8 family serine peptidase [Bacteroidota bacterium]